MRWRLVLPILALILFAFVSYGSFKKNREMGQVHNPYFWWSSIRLDSDPLNKHPHAPKPCEETTNTSDVCINWDDMYLWTRSAWPVNLLIFSALPAFSVGAAVVDLLGRLGISQALSFMVSMPLLLTAWYYFVGWLIDRRRSKRNADSG